MFNLGILTLIATHPARENATGFGYLELRFGRGLRCDVMCIVFHCKVM